MQGVDFHMELLGLEGGLASVSGHLGYYFFRCICCYPLLPPPGPPLGHPEVKPSVWETTPSVVFLSPERSIERWEYWLPSDGTYCVPDNPPACQAFFFVIFLLETNLESLGFCRDNGVMRMDNLLSLECYLLWSGQALQSWYL